MSLNNLWYNKNMEEIMNKLDNLEKALDNLDLVKEIKELTVEVNKNKELKKLIEEYQLKPTEEIKRKIIANDLFSRYKEKETDINILILHINQKLKELNSEGKSCK